MAIESTGTATCDRCGKQASLGTQITAQISASPTPPQLAVAQLLLPDNWAGAGGGLLCDTCFIDFQAFMSNAPERR